MRVRSLFIRLPPRKTCHYCNTFTGKVYHRIVNIKSKKERKMLDKSTKTDIITIELHTSLIKSGGGNGPMKPGNLL